MSFSSEVIYLGKRHLDVPLSEVYAILKEALYDVDLADTLLFAYEEALL